MNPKTAISHKERNAEVNEHLARSANTEHTQQWLLRARITVVFFGEHAAAREEIMRLSDEAMKSRARK